MAGARVEEGSFTVEVVDAAEDATGDGVVLTQLQASRTCTFIR